MPDIQEACLARGIIVDDTAYVSTIHETCTNPVFTYLLLFCVVSDPVSLWQEFKAELYSDFTHRGFCNQSAENGALVHIDSFLHLHGSSACEQGLPAVDTSNISPEVCPISHILPGSK